MRHLVGRSRILLVAAALGLALGACTNGTAPATASSAAACRAASIASPPGQAWWAQQRWRYPNDADAIAAYDAIVTGKSPWPDWFGPATGIPPETVLPVGTRFQMAMAPKDADTAPGGWGTFDNIEDIRDVREFLAVQVAFKEKINRVITYEVVKPLPVRIGPVGPQVDPILCRLLPGRWSQFNMIPPWNERMSYLTIVTVRPID